MAAVARGSDTHGIVRQALLDLRVRPDHRSEMTSQLLMGEVVRRVSLDHRSEMTSQLLMGEVVRRVSRDRTGGWWRVENLADGYRGWVRAWGLRPASGPEAERWARHARATVRRVFVAVRSRPRGGQVLARLWWNSRVVAGPRTGNAVPVLLPDGTAGWVGQEEVGTGLRGVPGLRERVLDLLGSPYLWGGRSPAGLDCSAFVQLLHGERGHGLPRDASDQHRACKRVPSLGRARVGDLLFFESRPRKVAHVGVWVGGGLFAHARGTVTLSSLDPKSSLYDKDLAGQFSAVGRPGSRR